MIGKPIDISAATAKIKKILVDPDFLKEVGRGDRVQFVIFLDSSFYFFYHQVAKLTDLDNPEKLYALTQKIFTRIYDNRLGFLLPKRYLVETLFNAMEEEIFDYYKTNDFNTATFENLFNPVRKEFISLAKNEKSA
ncbi:hypothetical protein ACX0G9_23030 [Flavitalea flava]